LRQVVFYRECEHDQPKKQYLPALIWGSLPADAVKGPENG